MLTLETGPDLSDDLFSQIDFSGGVIAAVSGGSDSTALLLLLKSHLDRFAPAVRLIAVTVDHDLRRGSAAEAQAVARLCGTLGIAHRILVWSGPKPSSGLPAAAREARYQLLAALAVDEGISLILTGHTADDQAETVLMRHARDGGDDGADAEGRGLAGMAPATLYDWRVWIVRPLLGTGRAALRAFLRGRGVGWAEDPTNADACYERPRIRAALSGDQGDALRAQAIAMAGEAASRRERLGLAAARVIEAFADRPCAGLIRLDPGIVAADEHAAAAVYALRILLATTGGRVFLPDRDRIAGLFERLKAGPLRATLSRSVVDARRSGIFLHREARDLPPPAVTVADAAWDGRRRITLSDSDVSLLIAPLGTAAARRTAAIVGETPQSLIRAALAAEPALFNADGNVLCWPDLMHESGIPPHLVARPVVAPFARFLPSFDLAPASIVAELVGALPVPAAPFGSEDAGNPWAKA